MATHDPLSRDVPLPLSYRREIVRPVIDCVLSGASCALVGVASTGKSNLFRFLLRPDVQEAYLRDDTDQFMFLYIDSNSMVKMSMAASKKLSSKGMFVTSPILRSTRPFRPSDSTHFLPVSIGG